MVVWRWVVVGCAWLDRCANSYGLRTDHVSFALHKIRSRAMPDWERRPTGCGATTSAIMTKAGRARRRKSGEKDRAWSIGHWRMESATPSLTFALCQVSPPPPLLQAPPWPNTIMAIYDIRRRICSRRRIRNLALSQTLPHGSRAPVCHAPRRIKRLISPSCYPESWKRRLDWPSESPSLPFCSLVD